MQLNSYTFVFLFLPVTVSMFWLISYRSGQSGSIVWLILCSIAFYVYGSFTSLALILPSLALDYSIAKAILRLGPSDALLRRTMFIIGVVTNVALLGYMKYRDFFIESVNSVFATNFELSPLLVPLGLSFLVFQKISFLSDVWSGQTRSVNFREFLLFALFFPRVIAGPIVRYDEIAPQLTVLTAHRAGENIAIGLTLFSIGLFKKTVLSDNVSRLALLDSYGTPSLFHSWIAMLAYTLQIYFDFSGYSDMALGAARMLGIKLPPNFNSPFKAGSIVEFWGRWHISLTRFLTDYIYTPLVVRFTRARLREGKAVLQGAGTTPGAVAKLVALPTFITLIISGVWHGAGWPFFAWGVLHAIYLTINQTWRLFRPRIWRDRQNYDRIMQPVGSILTFLCVVIAFVFFRAPSVSSAFGVVQAMLGLNGVLYPHNVLQELGGHVDLLQIYVWPIAWISGLLIVAALFPNSLEILRGFDPAPDDPGIVRNVKSAKETVMTRTADAGTVDIMRDWRRRFADLLQYKEFSFNRITAISAALLCVFGVASLGRGTPFFYAQF